MMKMLTLMLTLMIIMNLMMMLNNKMMKKKKKKNNNSSYECGFMNINKKRSPMSIQFYMISMIFLIFDLEMMVMIPLMLTIKYSSLKTNKMLTSILLMTMMFTMIYEWLNKSIKWKM